MPKVPPSGTNQRASPYSVPNMQRANSPRPPAGAWSPQDDDTLMNARAQGLSWTPIAQIHFPNKTGNACRKRHERLMEKRSVENWDGMKVEQLAREYLELRKEMWEMLANRVGEKWQVIEAKCMEKGLKNLQSAGRNALKRERAPLCEDDSGYAEMDAEPENTESAQMTEEREKLDRRSAPDQDIRRTSFEMPSIASILHSTPQPFMEKRRS